MKRDRYAIAKLKTQKAKIKCLLRMSLRSLPYPNLNAYCYNIETSYLLQKIAHPNDNVNNRFHGNFMDAVKTIDRQVTLLRELSQWFNLAFIQKSA